MFWRKPLYDRKSRRGRKRLDYLRHGVVGKGSAYTSSHGKCRVTMAGESLLEPLEIRNPEMKNSPERGRIAFVMP